LASAAFRVNPIPHTGQTKLTWFAVLLTEVLLARSAVKVGAVTSFTPNRLRGCLAFIGFPIPPVVDAAVVHHPLEAKAERPAAKVGPFVRGENATGAGFTRKGIGHISHSIALQLLVGLLNAPNAEHSTLCIRRTNTQTCLAS
jgi:hypothetical protein